MGLNLFLVIFAIAAIFFPTSFATEFIVGDESGWTINYDYQAWAAGKKFHVGDTLVFKYPRGVHNVFKGNLTAFQQCQAPFAVPLATGNDTITLATPGKKWYFCGVGSHCMTGNQKLAINVLDVFQSPSAAPAPGPSPSSASAFKPFHAWTAAVALATLFLTFAA
uniref:Phytocyanin domain-containing protein n=1 Tax=Kalanchoe fedtschenkoi TaxID=63787 RepID=A0A7N0TCU1_KALFE